MLHTKKVHPKVKSALHPRSKHRERYDFRQLIASCPALKPFVKLNEYKDESVDFFDPSAVKMLNKALLAHFYGIKH
jgi:23S rRNA (adenine1618-N6)-methyltransferase